MNRTCGQCANGIFQLTPTGRFKKQVTGRCGAAEAAVRAIEAVKVPVIMPKPSAHTKWGCWPNDDRASRCDLFRSEGRELCPWPDYAGKPIHEGDTIVHPDGTRGTVLHWPHEADTGSQWRVRYENDLVGLVSRLGLQIGEKGQAVVCGS